jgi:hypothetical protein
VSIIDSPVKQKKKLKLKNHERFICTYTFKKGDKKGQRCEKYVTKVGGVLCSIHCKDIVKLSKQYPVAKPIVKPPNPSLDVSKTFKVKINRLPFGKKFFVVALNFKEKYSILKSNKVLYKCKIPDELPVPPHGRKCIVRNKVTKRAEWM